VVFLADDSEYCELVILRLQRTFWPAKLSPVLLSSLCIFRLFTFGTTSLLAFFLWSNL
jgi:hypothetical protein